MRQTGASRAIRFAAFNCSCSCSDLGSKNTRLRSKTSKNPILFRFYAVTISNKFARSERAERVNELNGAGRKPAVHCRVPAGQLAPPRPYVVFGHSKKDCSGPIVAERCVRVEPRRKPVARLDFFQLRCTEDQAHLGFITTGFQWSAIKSKAR
jgi:hypothetical protein